MTILFAFVLLAIAFGIIGYPLLRGTRRSIGRAGETPSALADLLERRERIYADLEDLELDRGIGTLGQEDYEELSHRYRRQAVAVLKELRGAGATAGGTGVKTEATEAELAAEIERQVAMRRKKRSPNAGVPSPVEGQRRADLPVPARPAKGAGNRKRPRGGRG